MQTKNMKKIVLKKNSIQAVIFDMDGTMVNNMEYHQIAWREFFKHHGINITDEEFKKSLSGKKNDKIFTTIFNRQLSPEEIQKYNEEKETLYREIYKKEIQEVNGLHNMINQLKKNKIQLAIATTAPKKNRDFILTALKLQNQFEVILGDEDVTQGKPSPEIYIKTAQQLGVAPEKCLVFEDSPPGVAAGKNAGMTVIGITTTHSPQELNRADYCINDYTNIRLS
jgi:beta-phosphoglucomutase family hydrolase